MIRIIRAHRCNGRDTFLRYNAVPRVVQALPATIVATRARLIIAYPQKERIVIERLRCIPSGYVS